MEALRGDVERLTSELATSQTKMAVSEADRDVLGAKLQDARTREREAQAVRDEALAKKAQAVAERDQILTEKGIVLTIQDQALSDRELGYI